MDNYLRIALFFLGIIVVAVIVWDGYRKKKIAGEKSNEFNQDNLEVMMESRDSGGYDLNGVGLTRILGNDILADDEPLVAVRDDESFISDESFSADEQPQNNEHEDKQSNAKTELNAPELIITMSLLARVEDGFIGERLLHCMLSRGLRFGNMDIFHRHKHTSGEGPVQFSLANALKPGTFNLDDMGSFQTKGVTLFMILPGPKNPSKSYQLMLETAQYFAKELNGQLVDSSRSVLTQQTIQHFSEQIKEFERKTLSRQY